MEEDEVYIAAKKFLLHKGWTMLAGQPPSGCDHLPVVEIKSPSREGIGSKNAYKPDLIAAKNNAFLLIECKPHYDQGDADKLESILTTPLRMGALFEELHQRHIFERHEIHITKNDFLTQTLGTLAYHDGENVENELVQIKINNPYENSEFILPAHLPEILLKILRA